VPRDLATSEGGIGVIALASALVAAPAAVGDAAIAVPHHVFGREIVTALALGDAWRSRLSGRRCCDAQVIEVHAPCATDALDAGRGGERAAARLVQAPARGRDRAAAGPEAAATRIAPDRLAAV
jgi:hypothetical protein